MSTPRSKSVIFMKNKPNSIFQQSFIIIGGVLPHVLRLPKDWANLDKNFSHTISDKYLDRMLLFFKELQKKIHNTRKKIKVMYYIDTLPVYVTKAKQDKKVDKLTKLTRIEQ